MRGCERALALLLTALLLAGTGMALAEEDAPLNPIGTEPLPPPEAGLTLSLRDAAPDDGGIWHHAWDPEGTLVFTWEQAGEADSWQAAVTGPEGEADRAALSEARYSLAQKTLTEGTYTLTVTAYLNGDAVCAGSLTFVLEAADAGGEDGNGGGKPSGGGRSSGSRGGSRSGGGVTPGTALTATHAQGTRDLLPYGAVRLTLPEGEMTALTLGSEALDLNCGGAPFTGTVDGDTLRLVSDGADWAFTRAVLNTLALSGVRELAFSDGARTVTLDTDLALTGAAYDRERSAGFASSDFVFSLGADGFTVTVEDRAYRLEGDRLEAME